MSQHSNILVTEQAYQHLVNRCDFLRQKLDDGRKNLASLHGEEKEELGNHPLMDAQDELARLEGQLIEAELTLANAVIAPVPPSNIVAVGNRVVLQMCKGGCHQPEEIEAIIDGACVCECFDIQIVTTDSPLGAAIIGAKVGDECKCETPGGVAQITIISISRA